MDLGLSGAVVFITGAAGGIGQAAAYAFAREGAIVIASDLTAPEATRAEIAAFGQAEAHALDVTDAQAVDALVDDIVLRHGRIDVGFNNAGISRHAGQDPWGSPGAYAESVLVNQNGVKNCMDAELRHMRRQRAGVIINTSSIAGLTGLADPGYCASKHAVIGLTRCAAVMFAAEGIRVNAVCPGVIATPMTAPLTGVPEAAAALAAMAPMNRIARAEEVADSVVFLASPRAGFITGIALPVDGGATAR